MGLSARVEPHRLPIEYLPLRWEGIGGWKFLQTHTCLNQRVGAGILVAEASSALLGGCRQALLEGWNNTVAAW